MAKYENTGPNTSRNPNVSTTGHSPRTTPATVVKSKKGKPQQQQGGQDQGGKGGDKGGCGC